MDTLMIEKFSIYKLGDRIYIDIKLSDGTKQRTYLTLDFLEESGYTNWGSGHEVVDGMGK